MSNAYPVIIDRRDSTLDLHDNQLVIQNAERRDAIPLRLIDLIIVATPIHASSRLWQKLAEADITVVILPSRGKGQPAWISPGLAPGIPLRQSQYRHAFSSSAAKLAWHWVARKLHAQRTTLQILERPLGPLEAIRPPATLALDAILGVEGSAARHYFQQLARHLDACWNFNGRNRAPPRDPFNALLSLSYTLLTTEALHIVRALGFDPWLGFLHQPYPARPALALDLVEPFRPQIDLWCLYLANERLSPAEHFQISERDQPSAYLNKAGRNFYFRQWAIDRQNWNDDKSLRQCLLDEMQSFKHLLMTLSSDSPLPDDEHDPPPF